MARIHHTHRRHEIVPERKLPVISNINHRSGNSILCRIQLVLNSHFQLHLIKQIRNRHSIDNSNKTYPDRDGRNSCSDHSTSSRFFPIFISFLITTTKMIFSFPRLRFPSRPSCGPLLSSTHTLVSFGLISEYSQGGFVEVVASGALIGTDSSD